MAANNPIQFEIEGSGEIVATDNGNPTDMTPFPSHQRDAFSGKALVIIRPIAGKLWKTKLQAKSPGLSTAQITIESK